MKRLLCITVVILSLVSGQTTAADKNYYDFGRSGRFNSTAKTTVAWAKQVFQGYNFRIWLSNQGTMGKTAFDNQTPPFVDGEQTLGCEYPRGSGIEHLFGAGIWVGGIDSAGSYRAVSEGYNGYSGLSEILPNQGDTLRDRIWQTSANDTQLDTTRSGYYKIPMNRRQYDDDGDGKIDEDELDGLDNDLDWVRTTDDIGADGIPDTLEHGCRGIYDPIRNPDPAFDNFEPTRFDSCHPNPNGTFRKKSDKNRYTEKNGLPDHGEPHVDEDYAAISDNDYYMSGTDTFKVPVMAAHHPLGIKVFQKSYAWQQNFTDAILPMEYSIVNVQKHVIKDVYVGFFADMDIGPISNSSYYQHNFTAYLSELRTAYIHNPVDRGSTPLGITLLQAPRPLADIKYIFRWWDIAGPEDPQTNDSLIYEVMSGAAYPNQFIKPDQRPTNLSDSRFFFSFGPFGALRPGDTLKIVVALVSGSCVDGCPGSMVENAQKALLLHQNNYYRPTVPPSFRPVVSQAPGKVVLNWAPGVTHFDPMNVWDDHNAVAGSLPDTNWRRRNPPPGHTTGGRIFEGYRLYRSEDPFSSPASFQLLRDYDVAGDIFGANTGLDTSYVDTTIVDGRTYWYAVTSYGIPGLVIVEAPDTAGHLLYDSLYVEGEESPVLSSRVRVIANGGLMSVGLALLQGWSLQSNPLLLANDSIAAMYPQAIGAFRYAPDTGYVSIATAIPGAGYWIKYDAPATMTVTGAPIATESVHVASGWNMIGSISEPVTAASITTNPPEMSLSNFYGYRLSTGYYVADTLKPGNGYWVKSDGPGNVILSAVQRTASAQRRKILSVNELPPPPPGETAHEIQSVPRRYLLASNYPNPFNPSTEIGYQIADAGYVSLKVFDVLGREVSALVQGIRQPGEYSVHFDAKDMPSGIYYYRLDAASVSDPAKHFSQTRKMLLVR